MSDKPVRYLIACSGGPDSMALLDMCRKKKMNIAVAHVNYHKRETALRDERIVEEYCRKNDVPFYRTDFKGEEAGNFQDQARVFRYRFFAELSFEKGFNAVLVAHHKDDLLETYLIQKKRGSGVSWYGLKKETEILGVKIIRPLLRYTKKNLIDYCDRNKLEYGVDESNLENHYLRNRIRHEIIEKMSWKEKCELKKEIDSKNIELKKVNRETSRFIKGRYRLDEFLGFRYRRELLRKLISDRKVKYDPSDSYLDELLRQIENGKSFRILIGNRYLVKEYGSLEIFEREKDYSYSFSKIEPGNYPHFTLSKNGNGFEGVTVDENDFPLTVRNYKEGDFITMRYGTKKISRFFIDKKIPFRERLMWPVVFNAKGVAILVPDIGCDKDHHSTKHNLFVIKS